MVQGGKLPMVESILQKQCDLATHAFFRIQIVLGFILH